MTDQEILRRDITILALNNLIEDYKYALEEISLEPQEKEFLQLCVNESYIYLEDLTRNIDLDKPISKPQWKKSQ